MATEVTRIRIQRPSEHSASLWFQATCESAESWHEEFCVPSSFTGGNNVVFTVNPILSNFINDHNLFKMKEEESNDAQNATFSCERVQNLKVTIDNHEHPIMFVHGATERERADSVGVKCFTAALITEQTHKSLTVWVCVSVCARRRGSCIADRSLWPTWCCRSADLRRTRCSTEQLCWPVSGTLSASLTAAACKHITFVVATPAVRALRLLTFPKELKTSCCIGFNSSLLWPGSLPAEPDR